MMDAHRTPPGQEGEVLPPVDVRSGGRWPEARLRRWRWTGLARSPDEHLLRPPGRRGLAGVSLGADKHPRQPVSSGARAANHAHQ
jgi:hypothetical protein